MGESDDATLEADEVRDRPLRQASPGSKDLVAKLARASVESRLFGAPAQQVTVGKYTIVTELGTGGMGVVYRARDPELDRDVALKLLHAHDSMASDPERSRARLIREARAMARLSHPNVATVHEVGTFEDQVFVAMEHIEGVDLAQWLVARERSWREILDVFVQAGRGLAAAHAQGIVHRDFKPHNVMVGNDGRARVMDFGLARNLDAEVDPTESPPSTSARRKAVVETLTRTGALVGTPGYMAPEQYSGLVVDARSDQFSFCVSLWEAIYGERPFAGETVAALADSVSSGRITMPARARARPAWLRKVLGRGLRVDPAQRHPSMDALIEEILRRSMRGSPRVWLAAVGSAVATAVIVTTWAATPKENPPVLEAEAPIVHGQPEPRAPIDAKPPAEPAPEPKPSPPPPVEHQKAQAEPKPTPKAPPPKEAAKSAQTWCYLDSDDKKKVSQSKGKSARRHIQTSDGACYDCNEDDSLRDSASKMLADACERFAKCYRADCR